MTKIKRDIFKNIFRQECQEESEYCNLYLRNGMRTTHEKIEKIRRKRVRENRVPSFISKYYELLYVWHILSKGILVKR